ncbi:MAG TPA: hypothetical protein VFE58_12340 [Tepidisphaeraceae bacterium]|jgi:hypothetical protein|nr:hypothetical protein [Tepidisphaeraceae bacterium]
MKPSRWRSRIFSGIALSSFLIFLAAVTMEVRGYFAMDLLWLSHGSSYEVLCCMRGFLLGKHVEGNPSNLLHIPFYISGKPQSLSAMVSGPTSSSFLGNRFVKIQSHGVTEWFVACRLWQVMILSFPMPALLLKRAIFRRRRAQTGHCPDCGYDMRASPDRCPECGRPSPAA